jgi:hypothetical protein
MTVFLAAIDITIVTTALPTISSYFNSPNGYVWVGAVSRVRLCTVSPNLTSRLGVLDNIYNHYFPVGQAEVSKEKHKRILSRMNANFRQ